MNYYESCCDEWKHEKQLDRASLLEDHHSNIQLESDIYGYAHCSESHGDRLHKLAA